MSIKSLAIVVFLLLISAGDLFAQKTVLYNGNAIAVRVAYQNPTEIVFEGDEIASVIVGFAAESISMQNTANTLFVQPLVDNLAGDIYVINREGKSKILSLVSTFPDMRDRSIRIVNAVQDVSERISKLNKVGVTPAGLIRAMILGEDLDGVSVSDTRQTIIDSPIRLIGTTVYDAIFLKGYIVDMSRNEDFDIKTISMKGILAGAVHKGKGYFVMGVN